MNIVAELSWVAGFLEGEGCFSSSRTCAQIVATQKQREPLERVQRYLRCGRIYAIRGGQYWSWNIHGTRCIEIMFTLYPMLSPRRQAKVREVIARWRVRPHGKGGAHRDKTHCPRGHSYSGKNLIMGESKGYPARFCRACRDAKNAARILAA